MAVFILSPIPLFVLLQDLHLHQIDYYKENAWVIMSPQAFLHANYFYSSLHFMPHFIKKLITPINPINRNQTMKKYTDDIFFLLSFLF
ncbi:hypothetical protein PY093_13255 [Cytobacillus sp. S13-E01]|nr:hypothetical protein [Cytobacillus sp. S13-E01]